MRHRIEHFPFLKADSIRRAAEMGVPVCTQPALIDVRADDFIHDFDRLGPNGKQLVQTMLPLRTFQKEGVAVCFGRMCRRSFVPAAGQHPLRDGPAHGQRRAARPRRSRHIHGSAQAAHAAAHRPPSTRTSWIAGSRKTGDFVVWSKDLTKIATDRDLAGLEVHATFVDGKAAYRKAAGC